MSGLMGDDKCHGDGWRRGGIVELESPLEKEGFVRAANILPTPCGTSFSPNLYSMENSARVIKVVMARVNIQEAISGVATKVGRGSMSLGL